MIQSYDTQIFKFLDDNSNLILNKYCVYVKKNIRIWNIYGDENVFIQLKKHKKYQKTTGPWECLNLC